ncbi:hypothetical protein K3718_13400 [Leisingera aquaemixtae]|uniref:Uncharacterized protein n=1 Tax=Leisingera aquaemixtae TaxID=1396826 RepID=A0ABY5WGD9_9RHOB|nr:hypothetical protein [Leisingera aquaemixtae]UWQ40545.1 hypothetical protein K3718_13400 [Leisingera aquaemixtae]
MLSAVSGTASLYNGMKQMQAAYRKQPMIAEAGGQPVDAPLIDGTTRGIGRSLQRQQVLSDARTEALTAQYIGPARDAARTGALNLKQVNDIGMAAFYQDLMNGCQAGPKPVSALQAEASYIKARLITGS